MCLSPEFDDIVITASGRALMQQLWLSRPNLFPCAYRNRAVSPLQVEFHDFDAAATVWGTGAAWSCGRPVQPVASLGGWQFPLSTGKEVFLGPSPSATATVPGGDQGSERPEPQTFVTTGVQLWGTSPGIWPVEAEEFVGFEESSASSCRRSWTTDPGWFVPCGGPETCAAAKASLAVGGWESGQR